MTLSGRNIGRIGPDPFDDLDSVSGNLRPLWSVSDLENEKEVLDWCKIALNVCEEYYKNYFQVQQDNLLLYKGVQWLNQDKYSNRFLDRQGVVTRRSPKVVINHLYDFVEQWVSRFTRYKPAVKIFPANTEYEDEQDAKISQMVLDHIWYKERMDSVLQEFARQAKICGESYLYVTWNPNKGDIHPEYIRARETSERIPLVDPMGEPVLGLTGEPLYIDKAVRIGDVEYSIDAPWHTFDMPCRNREDIEWCIRWKAVQVDYLKAKYPAKADDIKPDSGFELFNKYRLDIGRLNNEVIVFELWHKNSEFLDKGRYMKWTATALLENTDNPYSHGGLPYLRLTDIDVPDEIRGMSFIQQLFPLQHQINACASLIYKSLVLFAHPKIVMPDGACEIQQLLNESTIVTYTGGVPPQLMTNNPVSNELFAYLEKLERTAEKISGVFTMSRGNAPSGVRAAKALRVLEEQEDKRSYISVIKFNENGIVENAKKTLSVAGDFYDDGDGRLARVVGKGNRHLIVRFNSANLSKPYDIRIEQTTALSQSPAARIDEITELQQVRFDPTAPFSREQFFNLLDLTNKEEFVDIATRAVQCAKSENEDVLNGKEIPSPTVEEDLITHWKIHLQPSQGREYKEPGYIPDDYKARHQQHILETEVLMFEKAFGRHGPIGEVINPGNPVFMQKLSVECPDWPVFLPLPAPHFLGLMASGAVPATQGTTTPDNPEAPMPPSNTPPAPAAMNGRGAPV